MYATEKLDEAKYHLNRMEEFYLKDDKIFKYELNAFLASIRSVPDILLQDYNEKFSLGIDLNEKLYPEAFEERAKQQNNVQAIQFYNWWKKKMYEIKSDKIVSMLFEKRNISVHRKSIEPDLIKLEVFDTITVSDSVTFTICDKEGHVISESKSVEKPQETKKLEESKTNLFFSDYPQENVLEVCRKLVHIMEKFVEEAEKF